MYILRLLSWSQSPTPILPQGQSLLFHFLVKQVQPKMLGSWWVDLSIHSVALVGWDVLERRKDIEKTVAWGRNYAVGFTGWPAASENLLQGRMKLEGASEQRMLRPALCVRLVLAWAWVESLLWHGAGPYYVPCTKRGIGVPVLSPMSFRDVVRPPCTLAFHLSFLTYLSPALFEPCSFGGKLTLYRV